MRILQYSDIVHASVFLYITLKSSLCSVICLSAKSRLSRQEKRSRVISAFQAKIRHNPGNLTTEENGVLLSMGIAESRSLTLNP